MSDPNNPNINIRTTPQWSLYQRESFWNTNDGKFPPFNTGKSSFYISQMTMTNAEQIRQRLRNWPRRSSPREAGK